MVDLLSFYGIPCQESANPSEEVLSLNPEISGFTEMVNRKSFYGTVPLCDLMWYKANLAET